MRKLFKIILLMVCGLMLVSCGAKPLSDKYSEEKLKAKTDEIIANINDKKFEEIVSKGDSKLKEVLTEGSIEEAYKKVVEKAGKYDSISKVAYQEKDGFAIVVAICNYENLKVQYTLTFNENMELSGIYMK